MLQTQKGMKNNRHKTNSICLPHKIAEGAGVMECHFNIYRSTKRDINNSINGIMKKYLVISIILGINEIIN